LADPSVGSVVVEEVLMHSAQAHKEYRFIFAVIPLWLLVGAAPCHRHIVVVYGVSVRATRKPLWRLRRVGGHQLR
jgi:hypothetical protein